MILYCLIKPKMDKILVMNRKGNKKLHRIKGLRTTAVLLMMMAWMMPIKEAWGQDLPFIPTTNENNPFLYWIETAGATGFYAVPHSDNTYASTTNAPTLRALWYFMATDDDGYYYIINYATGLYLKKSWNRRQ